MPLSKRRPTSVARPTNLDSSESIKTRSQTGGPRRSRFSQLLCRSKDLLRHLSKDTEQNVANNSQRRTHRPRHSTASLLDVIQPRPSLSTDRISRPLPLDGRHRYSHSRQFFRSETDLRLPPEELSTTISNSPPRFNSVVRRNVPRYSTLVRPNHSTILPAQTLSFADDTDISSPVGPQSPGSPPPPYSLFDPAVPQPTL
ncbi:hypothetical protein K435DRAFT_774035 [Dendrothele bispora CBS 962.96]|uniref:Uncharacterized protein n=1 Tax=Dendrothele bispora (strain CBS 962.96) TaxID=1314807 RepID=A0A4S8MQ25_DENBC|nr:hypothetical protein K435DRAFT_774035 [Dendrothele bispora CBS 962.96]